MPSPRAGLAFLVLLVAAALLQSTLSPRLFVLGGQPDFVFIVVIAGALLADAGLGALFGLAGGLLTGALVGETVGTFLVSRTLAGFVAGAVGARLFRGNVFVVMAGVALAALVAEAVYVLSAPGVAARPAPWIQATLVGTLWNALLALPVSALLRRLGWGRNEER
jgi:rod shape-determining protein MreD